MTKRQPMTESLHGHAKVRIERIRNRKCEIRGQRRHGRL
jgi:hypothetical protein